MCWCGGGGRFQGVTRSATLQLLAAGQDPKLPFRLIARAILAFDAAVLLHGTSG